MNGRLLCGQGAGRRAKLLTKDDARRIVANIAKLSEMVKRDVERDQVRREAPASLDASNVAAPHLRRADEARLSSAQY
jgi:hypothetical protein